MNPRRAVQGRVDSPPGTLEAQGIRGAGHPAMGVLGQNRPTVHADRWSGNTRDWSPIGPVTLNPERYAIIHELQAENKTRLAA